MMSPFYYAFHSLTDRRTRRNKAIDQLCRNKYTNNFVQQKMQRNNNLTLKAPYKFVADDILKTILLFFRENTDDSHEIISHIFSKKVNNNDNNKTINK